jgi:cytochrome c oxidase subunit 4
VTHDSSGGGEHASIGTYVRIAVVLSVITALEVGVIYVRQLAPIIVPLLIAMAAAKFALVALFFMHLRYDSRVLAALFVGPLAIAVGLTVALMTLTGAFLVFKR